MNLPIHIVHVDCSTYPMFCAVPELSVEGVSASQSSSRSVFLTWNPPPRYSWRGVIYYNIIVTETVLSDGLAKRQEPSTTTMVLELTQLVNNRDPSLATEPLQAEQFTVDDLEESFLYGFSIQIANDAGVGDPSPPVMQQMPEDGKKHNEPYTYNLLCRNIGNSCTSHACNLLAPSGPPINIAASDITSSSITIVWSPPDPREANGVIVGYKIIFTRVDLQDVTEDELGASARSYIKPGEHQDCSSMYIMCYYHHLSNFCAEFFACNIFML